MKNYLIDIEILDSPDKIPLQELKDKRLLGKDITPATIRRVLRTDVVWAGTSVDE